MTDTKAFDPVDFAIEELKLVYSGGRVPYRRVAAEYGVTETTLRRRYLAISQPKQLKDIKQQRLTPEQELELVQWINDGTHDGQPPASYLVVEKASSLARTTVGNG
jgi:hypothetical protein